jgi:cytochrome c553
MKHFILGIALAAALMGCTDKEQPTAKSTPAAKTPAAAGKQIAGDTSAGKAIAEQTCKACHGLDGKGVAPAIPNLGAQRATYLLASLKEYKDGKRHHAALKDMVDKMSDADVRNVVAYYASLPPVANASAGDIKHSSLYEEGKVLAAGCTKCHGENGNSKIPGTPSLAGQQPHYLVAAIQEYHQGDRKTDVMRSMLSDTEKLQLENLALYFASQTPVERTAPTKGDPAAGEPLSALCGGCHGFHGVSVDSATPSLAAQDPGYLVKAMKAYKTTRKNWGMQRYIAGLSEKDMENIAAYYAVQKPRAADKVPGSTQELAEKCNRCHDAENPTFTAPKMRGQDKDYLVMALRAYRDGKRESSAMHNMSSPYSNAMIENIASWYASQPAK